MQETSHDFKEKVEFQLDLGINKFILNAEKMTALNSEGYQVLLELLTAARIAGGDLSIINCEHVKTESEFHRDFNLYFYTEATS
ncbi:MAG: hypothetical protein IPO27_00140 [Bacteroidetes bacterium]|nr:hypothetical protein [Bacteroidota bacterium]